ncbi:aldehyde dehydrogenase [Leeia oryzae]|uniref:aldehyde dehydrogenase n=1 Tax=Leeia oryzae TaxID=356662 RepID=UPI0003A11FFD|nr:aldehyde dehydrogenase [Leeia oryzae]
MSENNINAEALDLNGWSERAANLKPETRLYIAGKFVDAQDEGRFTNINPATDAPIANMSLGTAKDIDLAVSAARAAYRSGVWSKMAPRDRMDVLYRLADLIEQHSDELALLDCLDMGKPITSLLTGDVPFAALTFRYFGETIDKIEGAVTNTSTDALHMIVREPLGVVGCITPWNYPLMMAAWKVAPALAAGNSVVLKPAEQSPMSALLLARLFTEAGGPDGVFNVVNGYGEDAGRALASHMDVDKISFTGSTEVGRLMMIYAGQSNMKRVTTELGGKSPQIIMDDVADIDVAVDYAIHGIYANQGEVCSASSRILVHEKIYDQFVAKFIKRAPELYQVGNPLDPQTTMGPLVTREQQRRVQEYIAVGQQEGARQALAEPLSPALGAGYFVSPTLFVDAKPQMRIAREEIFGPVATIMPFKTADEAIQIANDSIYGLGAGIWTSNLTTAHRMVKEIEAGMVWVNCYDHGDMTQPWGGYKQSGQGRDKCFETVLAHTQTKSVWIHLG